MKNLFVIGILGSLFLTSTACNQESETIDSKLNQESSEVRTINSIDYLFENNKVTQLKVDEKTEVSYGVISDIHGEVEKARSVAMKFKEMGVEGIILPGDLCNNENLRSGKIDSVNDQNEIYNVISAVAETDLPIFVIPGNHERRKDYESALVGLKEKFHNVIDMMQYRVFDGDDVDFVSLPGYQTLKIPGRKFIPNDGYYADQEFIYSTGNLRTGLDDSVVLITHGAGKTNTDGKIGPATIYSGNDVGDESTTEMMKENDIKFAVAGHIHEAGGIAATFDGKRINQGEWAEQFTANFGGLESWKHLDGKTYNGMAGVLTVDKELAKFEMIYIEE